MIIAPNHTEIEAHEGQIDAGLARLAESAGLVKVDPDDTGHQEDDHHDPPRRG